MPLSLVERLLAQAGQEGYARQVHFHVMGEPLLCSTLPDAVRLARRHGMEAWVTTNGILLTPELLNDLGDAGLSHLTISLQTPDASSFTLRGSRLFSFEEYRERLISTVRSALPGESGVHLSICFLSNPLHRFHAPGASALGVVETGAELRAHMRRWMEWIFSDTALAGRIPDLQARIRKAGILKEGCISLTPRLDFRVRALGNWAGHFDHPILPARFGYCPGLTEHFGVLWNGDYVFCCTDYDGKTALANFSETALREYFTLPEVQGVARSFQRYRVAHPHCRQCLGDRHPVSAFLRQAGSIVYFRVYRRLRDSRGVNREVV